jgi:hypothetical protein
VAGLNEYGGNFPVSTKDRQLLGNRVEYTKFSSRLLLRVVSERSEY